MMLSQFLCEGGLGPAGGVGGAVRAASRSCRCSRAAIPGGAAGQAPSKGNPHLLSPVAVRGLPCSMWDLPSATRDQTYVHRIGRQSLNHWTTREVLGLGLRSGFLQ